MGGCSMLPWRLGSEGGASCTSCCLLTAECDQVVGLHSENSTELSSVHRQLE